MKKNNFQGFMAFIFLILITSDKIMAEIIIFSSCDNKKDGFLKNEYIINLEKSLMTRNFVYNEKTFRKYRVTDLSVKKENTLTKFVYLENNKILTDKVGYPQFYTQLLFEIENPNIMIKTVINNEEAVSLMSTCNKIERFEKES